MRQKVAWLLCMGTLSLVLAAILISRAQSRTEIIFGGIDGAYVQTDSYTIEDPNAEKETEEDTNAGWPDIDITEKSQI